jgi:carboxymethylenebutenolidase
LARDRLYLDAVKELQRYLAEEIAEEHAERLITRREALRRLQLLGLSAAATSALLASVARRAAAAPAVAGEAVSSTEVRAAGPRPLPTTMITFRGPGGRQLMGAWAAAKRPRGGVLVIHENRGLTDHIRSVAGRFAASGYSALAIDLLSEEGGTASLGDEDAARAALGNVPESRLLADTKAGLGELKRRVPGQKLAAVGFCFGGAMVWRLLTSREPRLAAAAPFYGPFPEGASFAGTKAAVLGIYGGLDDRVNVTRDAAKAALERAGREHELVTFPSADHAFFNDTGSRYNPAAASTAYRRVLAWFGRYVAG